MQQQGGVESILDYFTSPEQLIDSSITLGKTVLIAECLAPIFIGLSMAYMFVTTWINNGHRGQFWNPAEVKRLLTVMLLIPAIPVLMSFIMTIGHVCAEATAMDVGDKFAGIEKLWDKVQEGPEEDFSLLFLSLTIVYKLMALFVMVISILFMYIIKFVILLFSGVFIQYCIIISPLAMAFSILPIFKDQVEKLMQVFFNACFVGLTMNILDNLFFDTLFTKIISSLNDPTADIFNYMVIASTCFTMCIFYLMAFWLTAKYVGSPGAAAVMSMATTAVTMATMAAMKMGGAAGGGAGGSAVGNSAGNIAKGAADDIKKE